MTSSGATMSCRKANNVKCIGLVSLGYLVRFAAGIIVAGILLTLGWFQLHKAVPVTTILPMRGDLVHEVFGTGTMESKVVVSVSSKIVGKVVKVNVDEGDSVSTGQCLAQLESSDFANAVRVAAMQRDQAEAQLAKAITDSARVQSLFAKQLASQADYDQSNTAYRVALANLNAAEASIDFSKSRLGDTRIISPVSGLVITRNLELGSTVVPGAAIFRISGSRPWVVAQVDERETGGLKAGQQARIIFASSPAREYSGKVVRLSAEVDRVTEEREVDVALDSLPVEGFLGARADVFVQTGRKLDVLTIPLCALIPQDGKPGVYVIMAGNAHWQPVQLGLKSRERAEVVNGLGEHDPVIQPSPQNRSLITEGIRVSAIRGKSAP